MKENRYYLLLLIAVCAISILALVIYDATVAFLYNELCEVQDRARWLTARLRDAADTQRPGFGNRGDPDSAA